MAFVADAALDAALNWVVTNGTTLHICSSEPANYAAIAAAELASAAVTVGAVSDRTGGGRKVTVPALTDEDVDTSGTASHWALSNGTDTLVATGSLASSASVDAAGTLSTTAFDIGLPDFANA